MDDAILAEIQRLAALGRLVFTRRVRRRMRERGVSDDDVHCALLSARVARWQSENDTWLVDGGIDLVGDPLVVIVAIEADLLIITVF